MKKNVLFHVNFAEIVVAWAIVSFQICVLVARNPIITALMVFAIGAKIIFIKEFEEVVRANVLSKYKCEYEFYKSKTTAFFDITTTQKN